VVSGPGGRGGALAHRRGKSGLHRVRAPGNAWAAQADGKCNRNIPPAVLWVRVKWCGKSAPVSRKRGSRANPARSKAE